MSKRGVITFKALRVVFKVALTLSFLVSIDMLCRYLNYFAEPSDGISIWLSPLSLLLYDDKVYTSRELFSHFLRPAGYTCLLFVVNVVFDIIAIVKDKKTAHTSIRAQSGNGSLIDK